MFSPTEEDKARSCCSLHGDRFPYTPHTAWPLLSAAWPHTLKQVTSILTVLCLITFKFRTKEDKGFSGKQKDQVPGCRVFWCCIISLPARTTHLNWGKKYTENPQTHLVPWSSCLYMRSTQVGPSSWSYQGQGLQHIPRPESRLMHGLQSQHQRDRDRRIPETQ